MHEEQNGQRRRFSAAEKVAILREHFLEKVPVSQVCEKHGLNPTVFYRWQKELFEKGATVFEGREDRPSRQLEQRVEALQAKLVRKDEVIVELMEDHVRLKKVGSSLFRVGSPWGTSPPNPPAFSALGPAGRRASDEVASGLLRNMLYKL